MPVTISAGVASLVDETDGRGLFRAADSALLAAKRAGRNRVKRDLLCDGGSLADRMAAAGGRISPDELVPIVAGVSEGLAAVHQAGLLHRDVKPHNVMIAGGRAKLGDLGLARPEEAVAQTSLTVAGTALGTLAYLAPERLAGVPATAAADVWSLGALVFQGLTGTLPRPTTTLAELVDRRLDVPPLVSAMAPDLGPALR